MFVELPDVGSAVKKGETFGVVESVKVILDVYFSDLVAFHRLVTQMRMRKAKSCKAEKKSEASLRQGTVPCVLNNSLIHSFL